MLAVVLIVFLGKRKLPDSQNGSSEGLHPMKDSPLLSRRSSAGDETIADGREEYSNSNGLSAPGGMYRGRTNSNQIRPSLRTMRRKLPRQKVASLASQAILGTCLQNLRIIILLLF